MSKGPQMPKIMLVGCSAEGNAEDGFYFGAGAAELIDCESNGNGRNGITVRGNATLRALRTTARDNGGRGFCAEPIPDEVMSAAELHAFVAELKAMSTQLDRIEEIIAQDTRLKRLCEQFGVSVVFEAAKQLLFGN